MTYDERMDESGYIYTYIYVFLTHIRKYIYERAMSYIYLYMYVLLIHILTYIYISHNV